MFKKIDAWLERGSLKNLEDKEKFLLLLQKHNTSVDDALQVIRQELVKERGIYATS